MNDFSFEEACMAFRNFLTLIVNKSETVAKYDRRKIRLENFAKLNAKMPKSRAYRRWKLEIFVCLPASFLFRNSFRVYF